jgi:hypothetical protein
MVRVSAVLLAMLCASTAVADVPPPSGDCANKKEGEACKDAVGKDGACGRIGYSSTNHATNPPTVSQSSYIGCRAGDKPTVTAKKCSVSTIGAPPPAGVDVFVLLAGVVYVIRRPRSQ